MKKDSKNCDRRSFLKTAVTSIAGVSLMGCEAQGAPNKGSSLQVWSCGGLAEAFMPANELYENNLTTTQQGIKVHKSADPAIIVAMQRLHNKGLVTEIDGGYLTDLGREAAEHAQAALTILTSTPPL